VPQGISRRKAKKRLPFGQPNRFVYLIMAKSDQATTREQRLAAKLRENLKRRKGQARARRDVGAEPPAVAAPPPKPGGADK
jgi:hypothetical protein